MMPTGVTTRSDSTKSSMCVWRVAKWPPERVAIQPPSEENSNDCGKCRSVSPWGRSWSSSAGPRTPAWMRAARLARSISSTRSRRGQVERQHAGVARRRARLDAADDRRAAAVGDDGRRPRRSHQSSTRDDVGLVGRERDQVGRRVETAGERRARRRGTTCRRCGRPARGIVGHHRGQRRRHGDPRRREGDVLERGRRQRSVGEPRQQGPVGGALGVGQGRVLPAPPPPRTGPVVGRGHHSSPCWSAPGTVPLPAASARQGADRRVRAPTDNHPTWSSSCPGDVA